MVSNWTAALISDVLKLGDQFVSCIHRQRVEPTENQPHLCIKLAYFLKIWQWLISLRNSSLFIEPVSLHIDKIPPLDPIFSFPVCSLTPSFFKCHLISSFHIQLGREKIERNKGGRKEGRNKKGKTDRREGKLYLTQRGKPLSSVKYCGVAFTCFNDSNFLSSHLIELTVTGLWYKLFFRPRVPRVLRTLSFRAGSWSTTLLYKFLMD